MTEPDYRGALAHLHNLVRAYTRVARKGSAHDARMALYAIEAAIDAAYIGTGAARADHQAKQEVQAGQRDALSDLVDSLTDQGLHKDATVQAVEDQKYRLACPCGYQITYADMQEAVDACTKHRVLGAP